jgi:rhodanese-related sulfurtransferase
MLNRFFRLPLNARLAALAFALGAVALFATPTRHGPVTIDTQDLALAVQRGGDRVSARTLADRLVKGQADFRVIDVRDEAAFARYHLPTAENVPIAALPDAGLPRNEKLLVYADDGVLAAQAWFLLRAQGYRGVYLLQGGLDAWRNDVMTPLLPEPKTVEERRENEARAALAAYFGGVPRSVGAAAATPAAVAVPPAVPVAAGVAAPALPSMPAKGKVAPKKKEGC